MYAQNTILELKEPKTVGTPAEGSPEEEGYVPASEDYQPFPYDRVIVVGPSPVDAGVRPSSWSGGDAQGVVIRALTSYGSILDEPFGKLQALYNVVEVPKVEIDGPSKIRVIDSSTADAGQTPEQVFATEAPGKASVDGKRVRTPHSPLEDPREADLDGPLGKAPDVIDGQRTVTDASVGQ